MDHEALVYKVDNPVQSYLLSSLVLTLIQGSIYWSTLRFLSYNIYTVSLYTTGVSTIDISSDDIRSVVLFPFEAYSLMIFNDPNISFSILISVVS